MKNNKIFFSLLIIICITILIYSIVNSYNKWYDTSGEFENVHESKIEKTLDSERIAFFYEYFPVLVEPFDYDILYENVLIENTTKEELEKYIDKTIFDKVDVNNCIIDYVLVDNKEGKEYNKYNYIAYFYDEKYYLDNETKDITQAILSMNINLIEYYPGNCKIQIPMN